VGPGPVWPRANRRQACAGDALIRGLTCYRHMHCAKDIISAIFIMAVSPFALKNLASQVLASRQSLYNANWRKYNSFSLSKKR